MFIRTKDTDRFGLFSDSRNTDILLIAGLFGLVVILLVGAAYLLEVLS